MIERSPLARLDPTLRWKLNLQSLMLLIIWVPFYLGSRFTYRRPAHLKSASSFPSNCEQAREDDSDWRFVKYERAVLTITSHMTVDCALPICTVKGLSILLLHGLQLAASPAQCFTAQLLSSVPNQSYQNFTNACLSFSSVGRPPAKWFSVGPES